MSTLPLGSGHAASLFALQVLVQVTVLVLMAAVFARCLLRYRAAARHGLWLCSLIFVLCSPVLVWALGRSGLNWQVRWPMASSEIESIRLTAQAVADQLHGPGPIEPSDASEPTKELAENSVRAISGTAAPPASGNSATAGSRPSGLAAGFVVQRTAAVAFWIWVGGVAYYSVRLARSALALHRLRGDLEWLDVSRLGDVPARVRRALDVVRLPPIAASPAAAGPFVMGTLRPVIVLPAGMVDALSRDQLVNVLVHECAHLVRRDDWTLWLQRLAVAFYWPHPLVHYLNRQLSRACEEVCDNYVLARAEAADYAQTLLVLAERYAAAPAPVAALAFFARSRLEDRVAALLDARRGGATRMHRGAFVAVTCVLGAASVAIAAARLHGQEEAPAESSTSAIAGEDASGSAADAKATDSRAWYILAQSDGDGLLFGLPHRLSQAIAPGHRSRATWEGVNDGGQMELDIELVGEAEGEIVVGWFADARWWLDEPVQVRRFPGAGRYTVENLIPGKYCLGAMIGSLPRAAALGVHRSWPAPVEIERGQTTKVSVRVSDEFDDHNGQRNAPYLSAQWEKMDPRRLVTVRTIDRISRPLPFCRVTFAERDLDDFERVHRYHEVGTDETGHAYLDQMDRHFSLSIGRTDTLPEQMAVIAQFKRLDRFHSIRNREVITITWDDFPTGTGKATGRVHDQHGQSLKEYFLSLTREVGERRKMDYYEANSIRVPVINGDGRFEVAELAPGTYTVLVRHFDYPTHAWTFDGPKFTIPDRPNAVVDIDVEVEAKELRYGRAVFENGTAVAGGSWLARFTHDPTSPWGGEFFSDRVKPDGSFRVSLSQSEREKLVRNSQALVEISAWEPKTKTRGAATKIHIDRLSTDQEYPTVVEVSRPPEMPPAEQAETQGGPAEE